MKIVFSPCLYCQGNKLYNLFLLEDCLSFICNYLNGHLDIYEEAFYSEDKISSPPIINYNEYYQYTHIVKMLNDLQIDGDFVSIYSKNIKYSIIDNKYKSIDEQEFQIICDYLNQLVADNNIDKVLMFIGDRNYENLEQFININFNNSLTPTQIPIVKNPWIEKSNIFNSIIKNNIEEDDQIFPNRKICVQLDELMKKEAKSIPGTSKGTHYKKYGKIIAYRNNFEDYSINDAFEVNTNYYIRKDGKYIISIDLIHGHFEVFYGDNELWFAEYSFSGEKLYAPTNKKDLNEMRQNHKVRKRHH